MINESEYTVRLISLPGDIKACLRISEDGHQNIYINDNLSPSEKRKAFDHECKHIERDDMFNSLPIWKIES